MPTEPIVFFAPDGLQYSLVLGLGDVHFWFMIERIALSSSYGLFEPMRSVLPLVNTSCTPSLPLTLYAQPFRPYLMPHPPYSRIGLYLRAWNSLNSCERKWRQWTWNGRYRTKTPSGRISVSSLAVQARRATPDGMNTPQAIESNSATGSEEPRIMAVVATTVAAAVANISSTSDQRSRGFHC